MLAAAVPAKRGEAVLELGCGVGVASLCLMHRVAGLCVTGIEVQAAYADLARQNARDNDLPFEVITGDIANLPPALRQMSFDHVIANPPFLRPGQGTSARDAGKEGAFREATPLSVWVDTAIRRLRPGGFATFIHRADRLPDILALLDGRVGGIALKPLAARQNRAAGRILVRARKGARGDFRLCAPLVLHEGAAHSGDRDSYTAAVSAILRDGAALEF